MLTKPKLFIGIAVVLAVIGGGVLVKTLFITKTSTPPPDDVVQEEVTTPVAIETVSTDGWKTCRNEEYGYEFKYPGEWYVFTSGIRDEITNEIDPCNIGRANFDMSPVLLEGTRADSLKPRFSIGARDQKDLAGTHLSDIKSVYDTVTRHLPTTKESYIDDEVALWTGGGDDPVVGISVFHSGTLFTIYSRMLSSELLNAIISTLRFLD